MALSLRELTALYQSYPGFQDAAAVSYPDPVLGERLLAVAVADPDHTAELDSFKTFVLERGVAPYKAPEQLVLVDTIPRTPDGAVALDRLPVAS